MNVINFNQDQMKNKHHKLLPNSIRGLIVGPSGCGKSNLLINLILQPGWIDWERLIVISPTAEQEVWDPVREFEDKNQRFLTIDFRDIDDAPDPEDLDEKYNNLIVFDDCMLENQKSAAKLFSRGRHKNADVLYLFQKYTEVPKVIRDNCNFIILFNGIDGEAIRTIHRAWCTDVSLQDFQTWFSESTSKPYSFVVIDLSNRKKKYRMGFDKVR